MKKRCSVSGGHLKLCGERKLGARIQRGVIIGVRKTVLINGDVRMSRDYGQGMRLLN